MKYYNFYCSIECTWINNMGIGTNILQGILNIIQTFRGEVDEAMEERIKESVASGLFSRIRFDDNTLKT